MTSEEPLGGYHNSYCSNFLLLRVRLTNFGQPIHSGSEMIHNWHQPSFSFPLHSGQSTVEEAVKTERVSQVGDVCYEHMSLFPVTFSPNHPLRTFLVCNEPSKRRLEFLFSERLSTTAQLQLCLVSSDAVKNTKVVVVPQKKQSACTAVSKESKIIEFETKKGIYLGSHVYEFGMNASIQCYLYV